MIIDFQCKRLILLEEFHNIKIKSMMVEHYAIYNHDYLLYENNIRDTIKNLIAWIRRKLTDLKEAILNLAANLRKKIMDTIEFIKNALNSKWLDEDTAKPLVKTHMNIEMEKEYRKRINNIKVEIEIISNLQPLIKKIESVSFEFGSKTNAIQNQLLKILSSSDDIKIKKENFDKCLSEHKGLHSFIPDLNHDTFDEMIKLEKKSFSLDDGNECILDSVFLMNHMNAYNHFLGKSENIAADFLKKTEYFLHSPDPQIQRMAEKVISLEVELAQCQTYVVAFQQFLTGKQNQIINELKSQIKKEKIAIRQKCLAEYREKFENISSYTDEYYSKYKK